MAPQSAAAFSGRASRFSSANSFIEHLGGPTRCSSDPKKRFRSLEKLKVKDCSIFPHPQTPGAQYFARRRPCIRAGHAGLDIIGSFQKYCGEFGGHHSQTSSEIGTVPAVHVSNGVHCIYIYIYIYYHRIS